MLSELDVQRAIMAGHIVNIATKGIHKKMSLPFIYKVYIMLE